MNCHIPTDKRYAINDLSDRSKPDAVGTQCLFSSLLEDIHD